MTLSQIFAAASVSQSLLVLENLSIYVKEHKPQVDNEDIVVFYNQVDEPVAYYDRMESKLITL